MDVGRGSDNLSEEDRDNYGGEMDFLMDEVSEYDPPEITLSALAETGRDEPNIPVLRQRSYTGTRVIPSALADTPCANLGVHGVFEKLNTTLGTFYILSPLMSSVLESYIRRNSDFGTVYAHLRSYWFDFATIEQRRCKDEENDREMRRKAIVHNRITKRDMPPRRVWDLYANRVVPYWVTPLTDWCAISHAWVSEEERMDVMTPINGYEWPVPMPNDANLDLIRIEMLNLGAGYVWLDVLCLRQEYAIREEDQLKEALRKEEWKLDVPTIGYVYDTTQTVVCYLSGLGRPLSFKPGDFESDRCWFNRAWTLQEIPKGYHLVIGGETGDDKFINEEMLMRVHGQLELFYRMRCMVSTLCFLVQMRKRVSTKPLDKVAGLVYVFNTESIPIYNGAQSEEDAWTALVDVMAPPLRADLFFYYPEPGNGNVFWRPSWEQVMARTLPWNEGLHDIGDVGRTESDWYEGVFIDSIYICGLADPSKSPREGKLIKDCTRGFCACTIVAEHAYPIPNGRYTLIGPSRSRTGSGVIWVVGRLRQTDGKFEKVSVIGLAGGEDAEKLRELHVERCVKTDLC